MKQWEIGASACGRSYIPDNIFEEYSKAGIKYMEIAFRFPKKIEGITPDDEFNWYKSIDAKKIVSNAEKYGIVLWSMHLPFGHTFYNIASFNDVERRYTIEKHNEIIKLASECGLRYVVIHPSGEPIEDGNRNESIKLARDSLYHLSKTADSYGINIAVENLPRTCLGKNSLELKNLIEVSEKLRVCFDVNHLLYQTHSDFVKDIGDRIATLHISDYDFNDEKHWFPGEGSINWRELIGLLKSINYTGPFMNEISCKMDNEDSSFRSYSELYNANKVLLDTFF